MSHERIETIEHDGCTIEVYNDDNPVDPREWDNLGTMVCFHRRYSLGDKHEFRTPEDFDAYVKEVGERNIIMLPLYLYDHSGITMNTSGFSCLWDSGQVGVIYVTREKILKEMGEYENGKLMRPAMVISKKRRQRIIELLRSEVRAYDQFLTGDVYGYATKDEDGEDLGSCWGYYGDEGKRYMIDEAKASIDNRRPLQLKLLLSA